MRIIRRSPLPIWRFCVGHISVIANALSLWHLMRENSTPVYAKLREKDSPVFISQGKVVSVMLPSRGRPDSLRAALRSLAETCSNPKQVEVLIRLDDDDTQTLAIQDSLVAECAPIDLRIIVGPRGNGYKDLQVYFNELAAAARGDFLFLFNDDARIKTKGWDKQVAAHRGKLSILHPNAVGADLNVFPVVHRKIVELLGYFSLEPFCDAPMFFIAHYCGIRVHLPSVVITHLHGETKDKTYTEASSAYPELMTILADPTKVRIRRSNVMRILRYLARCGRRLNIQEHNSSAI